MNELDEYTIERVTYEHYPMLQALFADAFNQKITIPEISCRYDTTLLGANLVGYIAIHIPTQKPAAYYGVFPVQLLLNGEIILAAQSGDTMTHKEHQRKGLFVRLATITFNTCKQEGINLIFGSPNKFSYRGFIHNLKWQHKEDIIRYDLKLKIKTVPLPKIFSVFKKTQSYYFKYAQFVLKKWIAAPPEIFHHAAVVDSAVVYRNKAYINYKTDATKWFIKIDEVIFWIKLSDVLWIGDMSNYEKVTTATLKKLKNIAFLLGYNTITLNMNESITLPAVFNEFKPYKKDAACFKMITPVHGFQRMIWTGADFDTW